MRISDWSSDVCSSDLILNAVVGRADNAADFLVGGKFLTYEPYALPFAKGRPPELRDAANATIAELFRSRRVHAISATHIPGRRQRDVLPRLFQLYTLPHMGSAPVGDKGDRCTER